MKTLSFFCCACLVLALMPVSPIMAEQTNGIAAVVNGRPILRSEVQDLNKVQEMELRRSTFNKNELDEELANLQKKTLDTLVETELILKEFEPFEANMKSKVEAYADERIRTRFIRDMFKGDRAEFLKQLTTSGLSYKKFYEKQCNAVKAEIMRSQNVKDVGFVTSEEKDAYLQAHSEDFRDGDQIKLWSITIPKVSEEIGTTTGSQLALAKEIRGKLLRGDDFSTLARTYSQDSKSGNGGDWGMIGKKALTSRLADQVFKLPQKKISEVIEYEDTFYVFYVEAKVPGKMRPKEEVDAQLEGRVLMEKRKKAYDEWITQLKRKATISYK
jgi:peptidyl-prolyl cis-trans isomerase SurA